MKYFWGFFPNRSNAALAILPFSSIKSKWVSRTTGDVSTDKGKFLFKRAIWIKFFILSSSRSSSVAPLSQAASKGFHRIYSFSSKYRTRDAYTEVRNPSISTKVLRMISRSTFRIKAVSLGWRLSSFMLFMKISRLLCNLAAKSYSRSVGDIPSSSSYPYKLPYNPR